jgi:hypothetical protein
MNVQVQDDSVILPSAYLQDLLSAACSLRNEQQQQQHLQWRSTDRHSGCEVQFHIALVIFNPYMCLEGNITADIQ